MLEQIVKEKLLNKDSKLKRDLDFIKSLLKDVGINICNGNLFIDKPISETLKHASMNLQATAKDTIHLKSKLIDPCEDTFKLLSDIENLLPTESISNLLQASSLKIDKNMEDKLIWQDLE